VLLLNFAKVFSARKLNDILPEHEESPMTCLAISTQCTSVTNGQTDGQTELRWHAVRRVVKACSQPKFDDTLQGGGGCG